MFNALGVHMRHFEQVPLETIKDIIEKESQPDRVREETLQASLETGVAPITVLLADDSDITRGAIRRFLLHCHKDIKLVGEAVNFAQAIQMSNDLRPHVIVMDLRMPDDFENRPETVKGRLNQGSQLVAISAWDDEETKALALSFGAAELLDKMKLVDQLVPTILKFAPARRVATA
jgi:DNA-binding NarL/FixJ family response regulator